MVAKKINCTDMIHLSSLGVLFTISIKKLFKQVAKID